MAASLRLEHALGGGGIFQQLVGGPDRTRHQIAPAIRATSAELSVRTIAAEGAFERADYGVRRRRRQRLVAAFAGGAQCKHCRILSAVDRAIIVIGCRKGQQAGLRSYDLWRQDLTEG